MTILLTIPAGEPKKGKFRPILCRTAANAALLDLDRTAAHRNVLVDARG
jgi:hypothetical protein